ncbi:MAG: hypothetical protein V4616_05050, partial [Bacteroidota bacterium]
MRFFPGLLLVMILGWNAASAQAPKRDDRTKPDPKKAEQEKAQKDFDKLPAEQKKVLLEVGKNIQKEQDEKNQKKSTKKQSDPAKTQEKPKTTTTAPADQKPVDIKAPVSTPVNLESVPAGKSVTPPSKTTSKAKTAAKTAPVKGKNAKAEEKEEKPLPPKVQKRPKQKQKYSEEQLKEYGLYTERITSDPDSADVAIMLPKTGPQLTNEVRLKKAIELVEKRFPDKALSMLHELVKKDSRNSNYQYWLGRAYLESYNSRSKSIGYLTKAAEHTDFEYLDKYPERNALAPVNALFFLGQAYHLDGNFAQAERHYRLFTNVAKANDPLRIQAEINLKQVAVAEKMVKEPKKNVSVTNLGPSVNSPYADYSPFVTVDGTELFFTTARPSNDASPTTAPALDAENGKYFDDIYVANLNPEGQWVDAQPISLDSAGNEVVRGISLNSKTLWLYQDNTLTADIYESTFAFGAWQAPSPLVYDQNTLAWGRNFNVDADRTIVYFASKTLGGYGGSDIFFAYRNEDGSWSEPRNVGPNVNTIFDEDMPFLHPNKRVLYYSSNSNRSMGGFDIYRSMLVGEWQTGENMGYPINTVEDDLYFSIAPDGKSAFYSRRGKDSYGDLDIYMVNFFSNTAALPPRLQATFKIDLQKAPKTEEPEEVNEIVLTNVLTREQFVYIPNIRTGNFSVYLNPCTKYNIEYRKNGAVVRTEDFVAPCEMQAGNSTMLFDPLGTNVPVSPRAANMPLIDKTEANLQGYAWQLQHFGNPETTMAYQDISYLNANGEIIRSVKLDSEGIFQFEDIPA